MQIKRIKYVGKIGNPSLQFVLSQCSLALSFTLCFMSVLLLHCSEKLLITIRELNGMKQKFRRSCYGYGSHGLKFGILIQKKNTLCQCKTNKIEIPDEKHQNENT